MTDDEKRQQKAMLLLQHEETRQELEHLRIKAWNLGEAIKEVAAWLIAAREMPLSERDRERDEKISKNTPRYRELLNFDAISELRDVLKRTNDRFRELTKQKKALGLGE